MLQRAAELGLGADGEDPHAADPRRGGVEEEQDELGSWHCDLSPQRIFFCNRAAASMRRALRSAAALRQMQLSYVGRIAAVDRCNSRCLQRLSMLTSAALQSVAARRRWTKWPVQPRMDREQSSRTDHAAPERPARPPRSARSLLCTKRANYMELGCSPWRFVDGMTILRLQGG